MTYAVEGSGIDGRVNLVCTSDGVRSEERNNFEGREVACIGKASKDGVYTVLGLRDQTDNGRDGRVRTASKEFKLGSTLDTHEYQNTVSRAPSTRHLRGSC